MAEQKEHPGKISYGQPDYALLRPILDTWLEEWGVKETFFALGEPMLQAAEYKRLWQQLLEQIARALGIDEATRQSVKHPLKEKLITYLQHHAISFSDEEQSIILEHLLNEIFGFSLLEPLLSAPNVRDIMVNSYQDVCIKQRGKVLRSANVFDSPEHLLRVIRRIFVLHGGWIDHYTPLGFVRMENARVYIALPPVAIGSPNLTIQKFTNDQMEMEDLIRWQSVSQEVADFLIACMQTDLKVLISGGFASGKTTVLNVLTSFIPDDQRIVKIEEVSSIQVRREQHSVSLESRPPSGSGRGEITIFDLLVLAKGMQPERIIVGELQGPEVLEVLRLMERGYTIMTLMHAENHENALHRLEMLVKFHNPELPTPHLRAFIGSAVDIIVQANRLSDGSRKITSIVEVQSVGASNYTILPIFTFQQTDTDEHGKIVGEFRSNTVSDRLAQRFQAYGIFLPGLMRVEGE